MSHAGQGGFATAVIFYLKAGTFLMAKPNVCSTTLQYTPFIGHNTDIPRRGRLFVKPYAQLRVSKSTKNFKYTSYEK